MNVVPCFEWIGCESCWRMAVYMLDCFCFALADILCGSYRRVSEVGAGFAPKEISQLLACLLLLATSPPCSTALLARCTAREWIFSGKLCFSQVVKFYYTAVCDLPSSRLSCSRLSCSRLSTDLHACVPRVVALWQTWLWTFKRFSFFNISYCKNDFSVRVWSLAAVWPWIRRCVAPKSAPVRRHCPGALVDAQGVEYGRLCRLWHEITTWRGVHKDQCLPGPRGQPAYRTRV